MKTLYGIGQSVAVGGRKGVVTKIAITLGNVSYTIQFTKTGKVEVASENIIYAGVKNAEIGNKFKPGDIVKYSGVKFSVAEVHVDEKNRLKYVITSAIVPALNTTVTESKLTKYIG